MTDKEFANIAARAAMTGIQVTRRGPDSFNVVRGASMFFFRVPGEPSFTRTTGCGHLANEIEQILKDVLPDMTVIAPGKWFKTSAPRVARRGLTIY